MKPTTVPFFATPIYKTLAGYSNRIDALKAYLLAQKADNKGFENHESPQKSPDSLYESHFNLFDDRAPEIASLKELLLQHLMRYLTEVNEFTPEDLQKVSFVNESWAHITEKGGYFQSHSHPMASVSMVYCVSPGDDPNTLEDTQSGAFVMHDPRHNASMYLDPANNNMRRAFSFNGGRFKFIEDELIIFPSYLHHHVEPYLGESPRITIAANFSFTEK